MLPEKKKDHPIPNKMIYDHLLGVQSKQYGPRLFFFTLFFLLETVCKALTVVLIM
jgi:hypothetical protein